MMPTDKSGRPLRVRRFRQETTYVHLRSDGMTSRRNSGSQWGAL